MMSLRVSLITKYKILMSPQKTLTSFEHAVLRKKRKVMFNLK